MDKVLLKAIEKYGMKQLDQTIEELSELIKEISKYKRYEGQEFKQEFYKVNILDEIVDVEIMLEQVIYILKLDENRMNQVREYKIARLDKRMKYKDIELNNTMVRIKRGE